MARADKGKKQQSGGSRIHIQVDAETGEEVEGVAVWHKATVHFGKEYMAVFQSALREIAADDRLNGEAMRVLMWLMGRVGFENFIKITQREIGEALGLRRQNVGRAVRTLEDAGYIERGPKGSSSYRIALHVGWKGSAKEFKDNERADRKQREKELYERARERGLTVVDGGPDEDE